MKGKITTMLSIDQMQSIQANPRIVCQQVIITYSPCTNSIIILLRDFMYKLTIFGILHPVLRIIPVIEVVLTCLSCGL
jgi:hypothetical protein